MAPTSNEPIVAAPVPNFPEARVIADFFKNLFDNTDYSLSLLAEDFTMQIMPASLKVPAMKRAEYINYFKSGSLANYSKVDVTPVGWTVDATEESVVFGAKGRKVVVEGRSEGISAINGEKFGQQYFFLFVVNKQGKIARIHEYVDSFYMARWTAKQQKAAEEKTKAKM